MPPNWRFGRNIVSKTMRGTRSLVGAGVIHSSELVDFTPWSAILIRSWT